MVYVLLAPGFEEAEALVPVDLLRRANVETATVSLTGEPVPGSHGITVTADLAMDQVDLDRAEMVVLPGGGPGYKNLGADPRVERLVREGLDGGFFQQVLRANFGSNLRGLNSFENIAVSLTEGYFGGYDPFRFPQVFEAVTQEDVLSFLRENVTADRAVLSEIVPKEA